VAPVLTIDDLRTHFFLDEGVVRAVDGVTLTIPRGGTLGLVGESGCGKSITALSILRLISPPGRIVSGRITFHGLHDRVVLTDLSDDGEAIRRIRGKEIAMIFQEPMTSLSPVHRVGDQIAEAVRLHTDLGRAEARRHAVDAMTRVGIPNAARRYRQFPHEMSGGLRQRAMIAMALSCRPALLIADEPTTALDVTIQAQILELMRGLKQELGMALLLITHDLGVVAEMADEVAVMYLGRVVEQAPTRDLYAHPLHPYTEALLLSIPGRAAPGSQLRTIAGSVPDALAHMAGCPFHPRCTAPLAGQCDRGEPPELIEVSPGHRVACALRGRTAEREQGCTG
jgi:oligopeptide/dipeptide ABC transporter ATP-binding protein